MCETTPFVNSVGTHYVASRAHIEKACDSLRSQGQSITKRVGLSEVLVHPIEESTEHIVKSLLKDVNSTWSTMVMRTRPFSENLFQSVRPNHQVLLSCKPHRSGCHQWRPMQSTVNADIVELQPDVIVECYFEAKYYHYDPSDIYELVDFNVDAENLIESDNILAIQNIEKDDYNAAASLNDNFHELETACPEWQQDTQAIQPKRLEHHQSGHPKRLEHHQSGLLTKDPGCPVCMEEAGSKVNHRQCKGDRQPRITHCDLATFEASAHGHKYCLVAAVTIELDKESKLLPIFIPMPKKDEVCAVAALKEALTICQDRRLHHITGSRIVRIQADGGGEFTNPKVRPMLGEERHIVIFSSSSAIFQWYCRANGWYSQKAQSVACSNKHIWTENGGSCACRFAGHMMREKVLGRKWMEVT